MAKRISQSKSLIDMLKQNLTINRNKLDDEIMQQSELFYRCGLEYSKANGVAVTKKEILKRTDAKLDGILRKKLQRSQGGYTETMVKNAIIKDQRHVDAFDAYINAQQVSDELEALKDAYYQRSFMLRDLASLIVSNYLSKDAYESSNEVKNFKQKSVRDQRRREAKE